MISREELFLRRHLPNAVNLPADRVARSLRALDYLRVEVYRGGKADWFMPRP